MNKLTHVTITTFVIVFCIFSTRLGAQSPTGISVDSTDYRDSQLYEGGDEPPVYSWLGGGFSVAYFMPDLTVFNKDIAQPFVHKDVASHVLMFGGQGFIPFPFVRNIRIGGAGYGGKTEQCCVTDSTTTTSTGQQTTRSLRYSIGYGALMLDYALPIPSDRFKILFGTEIGLGGIDIEAKQAASRTKFDIGTEFNSSSTNYTHTYSSSFVLLKPRLTFEYAPTNFMMFNLAAGYQATFMGTWIVDGDVSLGDEAALKNVKGSGLVFNLGINIGFFQ